MMPAMAFPCRLDEGLGRFRRLTREEEIEQSVRMILTTRPGERPLRADFGANLDRFAFEDMNTTTRNLIRREVISRLLEWEPRITDVAVDFEHAGENGDTLLVKVTYRVLESGREGLVAVAVNER